MLDLLDKIIGLAKDEDDGRDDARPVANRGDHRDYGLRRGRATHQYRPVKRQRPAAHPLAADDGLTLVERADEEAARARLDAAHARNEALPEDEQAPWILPAVEQGYRDRRASRRRQRRARAATRRAR